MAQRVAVVTGAGGGMGARIALDLVRAGYAVGMVDLNPTGLERAASLGRC